MPLTLLSHIFCEINEMPSTLMEGKHLRPPGPMSKLAVDRVVTTILDKKS